MRQDKYCLVLSGGGAKGVYHIGAWKALRELGIEVEAVVGNSIGAIIAAFVAQDRYEELEDIGSRIGLDYILNVPKELVDGGELSINRRKRDAFRDFYRSTTSKKGLDTSPMRNLLEQYIDEERIRRSPIDFGIVTYNISDMKPREVFVEEMADGTIADYAMASSAFPGFQRPEIAGKKYIDGGVFSNIPYSMARSRGYRSIIVIDISGMGVNRKPDIQGSRTVYIKNSINMGGVLDFDRDFMNRFTLLGYLDTMKTFGRLRGADYFIEPDDELEGIFREFLETEPAMSKLLTAVAVRSSSREQPEGVLESVRRLFPKEQQYDPHWLAVFADCAARSLSLERIRQWSFNELFDALDKRGREVAEESEKLAGAGSREFISRIRRDMKERRITSTPYLYHLLGDQYLPPRLRRSLDRFILDHYQGLASGVYFMSILEEFRVFAEGARV